MIENHHGIRLLSGGMFNYHAPHEGEVLIEDIAAPLSKICRFSGHLPEFYSVAQHAVNVSLLVPEEHAFTAIMHDTAEAFTNDLPTPLKHAFPVFKELEEKIEGAMAERFGFQYPLPPEVKHADTQMLGLEKVHIKRDFSTWAVLDGVFYLHLSDRVHLDGWAPEYARAQFLARYDELRPK